MHLYALQKQFYQYLYVFVDMWLSTVRTSEDTHTRTHAHTSSSTLFPPCPWLDVRPGCWMLDEDLSIQLYVVSQLAGK